MAESFDAVLAEMRTLCDWPYLGHTSTDSLAPLADRLQSAHEAEVAERDRMVGEQLAIAERAKAEALRQQQERLAATVRADRAVGLLREIPSVLAYAMNLCNSQASEALQDEAARQINSCNARIREALSEQAGERENGDG